MKDKAFARAVRRDNLRRGAEELGLPLDCHMSNVIAFMRDQADALGLRGRRSNTGGSRTQSPDFRIQLSAPSDGGEPRRLSRPRRPW